MARPPSSDCTTRHEAARETGSVRAVIDALAAIRHGLDHARGDRSKDVEPVTPPYEISMSAEDVAPENDPSGEPEAVRLYTKDGDDEKPVLAAVIPTKLPEN